MRSKKSVSELFDIVSAKFTALSNLAANAKKKYEKQPNEKKRKIMSHALNKLAEARFNLMLAEDILRSIVSKK